MMTIRTVAVVALLHATASPLVSQTPTPLEVAKRFINLDSRGGQLTDEGWREIASLFVNPGAPPRQSILVTDGGALGPPTPAGEKVGFSRTWMQFGRIDLRKMRFSTADVPVGRIVGGFDLLRTPGPGGRSEWRIEGAVHEPIVTVDAAIQYVTKVRAVTRDAVIKKNADRTLAALRRLRG
jgi:hypothetical protein